MTPKTPDALEARATPAAEAALTSGRYQGQVAFITGANDKGIGGAIAERFASEGASIAIASLEEPKRLVKKLGKQGNGVVFARCDVTRSNLIRQAIDATLEEFGKIDIIVNNAGVEVARSLRKFTEEQWRQMLAVNLDGAIAVTHAALDHLTEPGGVIVNIASALGLGGCAGFSIYSASKAGLIGFTQSLAWELAPRGIRIVGVAPGLVHTPMIHKHIEHLSTEDRRQIESCHPLGIGLPHDVASAVAFLASDEARWITGVTLPLGFAHHYPLPTKSLMVADGHG